MARKRYYQYETAEPGKQRLQAERKALRDQHAPGGIVSYEYAGRTTSKPKGAGKRQLERFFEPQIVERKNEILGMTFTGYER